MDIVTALFEWGQSHAMLLGVVSAVSLLVFIGTLAVLPFFVARIPEDYFLRSETRSRRYHSSFPAHLLYLTVKNLAGAVFIIAGIAMLFIPGQGILTILIGVILMNFPGKRSLEIRVIGQPGILRAVNWMRRRSKRPPLTLPPRRAGRRDRSRWKG